MSSRFANPPSTNTSFGRRRSAPRSGPTSGAIGLDHCPGHHVHAHHHLAIAGRAVLDVVRGRKPPSAIFITVACGSVVETRASFSSPGLIFASISGIRSSACSTRSNRSSAWRIAAASLPRLAGSPAGDPPPQRLVCRGMGGSGQLLPQPLDLGLGLLQESLQGLAAAKRGRSGTGADAHAILSDAVQIDQASLTQHLNGLLEQLLDELEVVGTEIGERVVVDGDPPASQRKAS